MLVILDDAFHVMITIKQPQDKLRFSKSMMEGGAVHTESDFSD